MTVYSSLSETAPCPGLDGPVGYLQLSAPKASMRLDVKIAFISEMCCF